MIRRYNRTLPYTDLIYNAYNETMTLLYIDTLLRELSSFSQ